MITLTDGHDLKAIHAAIEEGKNNNNGKPTAIICKIIIGKGIDEVADNKKVYDEWTSTYAAWKEVNGDKATILENALAKERLSPEEILAMIPEKEIDEVTRASGSTIINQIAEALPTYISGAADLHCSNKNYIKGASDFGTGFGKTYSGRNCYYGIMNGNSYGQMSPVVERESGL